MLSVAAQDIVTAPERAQANLFIGLAQAVLGQAEEARASFRRALLDDAEAFPDRERISPTIVSMFIEVQRTVKGRLEIETTVPAIVYFDDLEVGRTPFAQEVAVGRHKVRVLTDDSLREAVRESVLIRYGETTHMEMALIGRPGRLFLRTRPRGAEVLHGEELIGVTPLEGIEMPSGPLTLRIRTPGFKEKTVQTKILPAEATELDLALEALDLETMEDPPMFGPDLRADADAWTVDAGGGVGGTSVLSSDVERSGNLYAVTGGLSFGLELGVSFFDLLQIAATAGMETFGVNTDYFASIAPTGGRTYFDLGENASGSLHLTAIRTGILSRLVLARFGRFRPFVGIGVYHLFSIGDAAHLAFETSPPANDGYLLTAGFSGNAVSPSFGVKVSILEGNVYSQYFAIEALVDFKYELISWTPIIQSRGTTTQEGQMRAQAGIDAWRSALEDKPSSSAGTLTVWVAGRL